MLVVRLAIRGRASGMSLFNDVGAGRIAADAKNGMKRRKRNDNDSVDASARGMIFVTFGIG